MTEGDEGGKLEKGTRCCTAQWPVHHYMHSKGIHQPPDRRALRAVRPYYRSVCIVPAMKSRKMIVRSWLVSNVTDELILRSKYQRSRPQGHSLVRQEVCCKFKCKCMYW